MAPIPPRWRTLPCPLVVHHDAETRNWLTALTRATRIASGSGSGCIGRKPARLGGAWRVGGQKGVLPGREAGGWEGAVAEDASRGGGHAR